MTTQLQLGLTISIGKSQSLLPDPFYSTTTEASWRQKVTED